MPSIKPNKQNTSEKRRAAEEKNTENLKKALQKFKMCPNGLLQILL